MNILTIEALRRVEGINNRRRLIQSQFDLSDWERTKALLDEDHELYWLWCRESNELSRLLSVTVYSSPC